MRFSHKKKKTTLNKTLQRFITNIIKQCYVACKNDWSVCSDLKTLNAKSRTFPQKHVEAGVRRCFMTSPRQTNIRVPFSIQKALLAWQKIHFVLPKRQNNIENDLEHLVHKILKLISTALSLFLSLSLTHTHTLKKECDIQSKRQCLGAETRM